MSAATVDRYLKRYRNQFARKKRTGTVRGSKKFQNVIPLKIFEGKNTGPGFIEADTVAHCGNSLSGKFAWSISTNTNGYIWFMGNKYGAYFQYETTRSGKVAQEMLGDFSGVIINDGFTGYNRF